jgi:hypothetical protein
MDNPAASGFLKNQLMHGEKIVYRSPRNRSQILGTIIGLVFAILLGAVYVLFSTWQQNMINYAMTQADIDMAQGINYVRMGVLVLAGFFLVLCVWQLAVLLGAEMAVTDRRVLGRTGRYILRKVDIPFEKIAWVDFPKSLFAKGPVSIHARDGKSSILWNLAKPEVFLGYVESAYAAETRPMINRKTSVGKSIAMVIVLVLLGAAAYFLIFSDNLGEKGTTPSAALTTPAARIAATLEPTSAVEPTTQPTATRRPTATTRPKPIEVDFASLGNYPTGTEVILVGRLGAMSNAYCDNETCSVVLKNIDNTSEHISIFIDIPAEGATPAPNEMKGLFEGFQQSDIRVRTADGTYALVNYRIRIQGHICETTDGSPCITDISKIELVQVQ